MNKGTTGSVERMVTVRENCELGLKRDTEDRRRSVVGEVGATGVRAPGGVTNSRPGPK